MREILFRGKRKDNGEWVEGSLIKRKIGCFIVDENNQCALRKATEYLFDFESKLVIPETVGQYTGLTDKNGKKIFEGDIHEHEGNFFVVEYGKFRRFDNSDFAYGWHFRSTKNGVCEEFYGDEEDYVNITGNIHDNPELLEVHNGN